MKKCYSDDNEFAILILHHREKLSDEEVEEWLEDPEHVKLLEKMACFRMEAGYVAVGNKKELLTCLRKEKDRKRIMKCVITFAASVVLALGAWQIWMYMHPVPLPETVVQSDILSGKRKAQLILADGKVVDLHSRTQEIRDIGNGLIRNDSVYGLKYQVKEIVENESVAEYNTLRVPPGGFYKLELSDGTKVWLNAASELKFPVQFGGAKREVYLKGEGYFEVTKDSVHQFVVHVKNAAVSVLGTVFNINAYEEESQVYTTLAEGAVAFYSQQKQQQVILKPGMQSIMDVHTGSTSVAEVDPAVYSAWVGGRFVFQTMDLDAIMRQLQRWYDCEVVYRMPEVRKYEFRGVINRDMEIRQVLDIIEETTDLTFVVQGKTIIVKR